jgi:glucosamine-6-phosphate deaminase
MNEQLFNQINIKKENTYVPKGMGDVKANAAEYEKLIKEKGPFDICLLGVGTNGHIAFNEPGSE